MDKNNFLPYDYLITVTHWNKKFIPLHYHILFIGGFILMFDSFFTKQFYDALASIVLFLTYFYNCYKVGLYKINISR